MHSRFQPRVDIFCHRQENNAEACVGDCDDVRASVATCHKAVYAMRFVLRDLDEVCLLAALLAQEACVRPDVQRMSQRVV